MMHKWLTRRLPLLGLLGLAALPVHASYADFVDVQQRDANPSPADRHTGSSVNQYGGLVGSIGGAGVDVRNPDSNIDNYINQDEQINLTEKSGRVNVLRTNQKNVLNDYVTAVFPLNYANRREIRNVMRLALKVEGGWAEVWQDKVGNGQSSIQVVAPRYMIPYLRDAVAALDVPWLREYDDGAVDFYAQIKHRRAADVDLIAAEYGGGEGFSTIDVTNNAVRRFDEAYRVEQYQQGVEQVDKPCNQVALEVTMYEVNASNDLKLGVDYIAWRNGPGRNLFQFAEAGYSAEQRAKNLTSVFDPFLDARAPVFNDGGGKDRVLDIASNESYRAVNYLLPSSYVDFLQAKGVARIMTQSELLLCSANTGTVTAENTVMAFVNNANDPDSEPVAPQVITRNNIGQGTGETAAASAKFFPANSIIRNEVPIGDAPNGVSVADSSRELRYESAGTTGISMALTPFVGLESMELDLSIDIGELNGVAPNGLPIINTRTVETTVRLLDGQPFVIAGLHRVNKSDNTQKAPWLGSIPVLGYLFGGETDTKRVNDVVITIKPRFYVASQISIARPPVIDTMQLTLDGVAAQASPDLDFGFDQYLIGS